MGESEQVSSEKLVVAEKKCAHCKVIKPIDEFGKNRSTHDGKCNYCRICMNEALKRRYKNKTKCVDLIDRKPVLADQTEEVKKIVSCLMEHPEFTVNQVAEWTGMRSDVVGWHMGKNDYMRAVNMVARRKMTNLIPLAVKGYRDALESGNIEAKLRSSMELLKSENIMGPTRVEVTNGITDLTVKQLQEIVSRVRGDMPEQTIIDAEAELA